MRGGVPETGGAGRGRGAAAAAAGTLAALLIVLGGCAEMAAPPGGPVDTASPAILSATPESLATGVDARAPLEIRFSEKMSRESLRDWLFIRPFRRVDSVRWKGAVAQVTVRGGWPRDSTVSVVVGTGVADNHGNPLARPFQRTFSTGDSVDPGLVTGQLFRSRAVAAAARAAGSPGGGGGARGREGALPTAGAEEDAGPGAPPAGAAMAAGRAAAPGGAGVSGRGPVNYAVFVWLYRASGDTLPDLAQDDPDYLTQVDADGSFQVEGLPLGVPLQLYAVQDNDRSRTFSESARDYATLHPDTLRLTAAEPARRGIVACLIDPRAPGIVSGALAARADTAGVDTLSYGVIVSEMPADTARVGWPPARVARQGKVEKDGRFSLSGVLPGAYRAAAFLDANRDGQWTRLEALGAAVLIKVEADLETGGLRLARPSP